ncbi:hypothetical protein EDB80DRAFT_693669 [Ilyonectria destructans]|nr:hypothetical protein EDB80DRAFT_693669 [Ilyonectria destructans]
MAKVKEPSSDKSKQPTRVPHRAIPTISRRGVHDWDVTTEGSQDRGEVVRIPDTFWDGGSPCRPNAISNGWGDPVSYQGHQNWTTTRETPLSSRRMTEDSNQQGKKTSSPEQHIQRACDRWYRSVNLNARTVV